MPNRVEFQQPVRALQFMRLEPVSNVDNRRSLKERFSDLIGAIVDIEVSLQFLGIVVSILVGLGVFGYVTVTWLLHLIEKGHYVVSFGLSVVLLAAAAGAIARIPIAMLLVFGSAMVCGTAFLLGAGNVLLP